MNQSITQTLDELFAHQINNTHVEYTSPRTGGSAPIPINPDYPMPDAIPIELADEAPKAARESSPLHTPKPPYQPSVLIASLHIWNNGHGRFPDTNHQFSNDTNQPKKSGNFLNLLNRIINK